MGNSSSNENDNEPRNFEFKCSFMLNGGRMDCVEMEMENPDKNTKIPKNKKHMIQQCLNHFKQPIFLAGRQTLKENTDWNAITKATQIVLSWAWLLGGLFTGLGAGLDIPGLLIIGILSLVVYAICAVLLPFYLLPKYDELYLKFTAKVDGFFSDTVDEYRKLLEPGYTVKFYKRTTDPPMVVEAMDKTPPWTQACTITGLTIWVIPFFIVITNFCCMRCFPNICETYEVEVKFDVEAAKGHPTMPQQQAMVPIGAAIQQPALIQPGMQPVPNMQPVPMQSAAQPVGMQQPAMPGMPGGMPLMTPEQYQHYFNTMMSLHAQQQQQQSQGPGGLGAPLVGMQMPMPGMVGALPSGSEVEVVTSEGEGGEGAPPPAYGGGQTNEMQGTGVSTPS